MADAAYIPWLALGWGLAGGFSHCIGMCGVFVAAYTSPSRADNVNAGLNGESAGNNPGVSARTPFIHPERHLLFHGGRLFSLSGLGLIAGSIGQISHRWAAMQGAAGIAAGIVMLGLALGFAGVIPWFRIPEPDVLGAGGGTVRRMFVRALQSHSALKPLFIGVFVGLLPCGLTYQALIPAAMAGSALRGAAIMALFCLGTIPGLLALGVFGNVLFGGLLMRPAFRNGMTRVAAGIMAMMGVLFIVRGVAGF